MSPATQPCLVESTARVVHVLVLRQRWDRIFVLGRILCVGQVGKTVRKWAPLFWGPRGPARDPWAKTNLGLTIVTRNMPVMALRYLSVVWAAGLLVGHSQAVVAGRKQVGRVSAKPADGAAK